MWFVLARIHEFAHLIVSLKSFFLPYYRCFQHSIVSLVSCLCIRILSDAKANVVSFFSLLCWGVCLPDKIACFWNWTSLLGSRVTEYRFMLLIGLLFLVGWHWPTPFCVFFKLFDSSFEPLINATLEIKFSLVVIAHIVHLLFLLHYVKVDKFRNFWNFCFCIFH